MSTRRRSHRWWRTSSTAEPSRRTPNQHLHLSYYNEEMQAAVGSQIVEGEILLVGRTTYEVFAASWRKLAQRDAQLATRALLLRGLAAGHLFAVVQPK